MEWGTEFHTGLLVGLVMAAVFVVWVSESWRRAFNKLLAIYYEQRRELKKLQEENGAGDL